MPRILLRLRLLVPVVHLLWNTLFKRYLAFVESVSTVMRTSRCKLLLGPILSWTNERSLSSRTNTRNPLIPLVKNVFPTNRWIFPATRFLANFFDYRIRILERVTFWMNTLGQDTSVYVMFGEMMILPFQGYSSMLRVRQRQFLRINSFKIRGCCSFWRVGSSRNPLRWLRVLGVMISSAGSDSRVDRSHALNLELKEELAFS